MDLLTVARPALGHWPQLRSRAWPDTTDTAKRHNKREGDRVAPSKDEHGENGRGHSSPVRQLTGESTTTSTPWSVGATGFEPATARPPAECATSRYQVL